ncbi:MAG: FAD-binding protein [Alteromonadaceae bacterium]|nr:FAD-binding protein [Alteromonadaceae bacterium]
MLPLVDHESVLEANYLSFLDQLKQAGFSGEINTQYSSRLAVATDNSVYQKLPQAVILPKSVEDLQLVGKLAAKNTDIKFSARGGGTGTNGQSLTSGIVVDVSKHMNNILEINTDEAWVRVQAGVVKDQLNDFLRPHGFFFAPDLSTSNRATIGGMINTDASGQGSLVYGKTSDHVLGLKTVLADGTLLDTVKRSISEVADCERYQAIIEQIKATSIDKRDKILAKFPRLNRFLTGYDLENVVSKDLEKVDVSRIITGSEGSLGFVAEAKLNVTPIPKNKVLVNVMYNSFEAALRHAPAMIEAKATSVETIDSKVLNLAKQDIIWHSVSALIEAVPEKDILGLNIVEYNDESKADIDAKIESLKQALDNAIVANESGVIGYQITESLPDIGKIYAMRKKAVGLLGKTDGWKKPVAFAEDTAVPPENLADFIMEFRALLDAHNLDYGMFGHVDAGVLHVRPALDLCDPKQGELLSKISDEVVALVAKYGGLMWGEHGKGYRSEYAPAFFGDELFAELRKIKAIFDPHNQMNPGKICTPIESEEELVKVSDLKRGDLDRAIPIQVRDSFAPAMSCNGNGLCFNYDTSSPMCPSSKITRDRRHSPKGRAGMLREWLRLLSKDGVDIEKLETAKPRPIWERLANSVSLERKTDFSEEVFDVMDHCLACKACTNQCPVNVDIPTYRARFLAIYYQRYARPLKDLLVANIEKMAPQLAKIAPLHNFFMRQPWMQKLLRKSLGYVDSPLLSVPTLQNRADSLGIKAFDLTELSQLSTEAKQQTVLIVQDPFTSYYEAELLEDTLKLARALHKEPVLVPFKPNGKPQHVKGFLTEFAKTAQSTADFLNQLAALEIDMIGVDPSLVLCYRDEYTKTLGNKRGNFNVLLTHEWLAKMESTPSVSSAKQFTLLAHCTEKTFLPAAEKDWQAIFANFGLQLHIQAVGCCGMAGTFGHETKHLDESIGIFNLSWKNAIEQHRDNELLATGYSCRSQVKRLTTHQIAHPLQALLRELEA